MLQFGMALLIDGYNLLNVTGIFAEAGLGTELHRTRLALLDFLAASIDRRERRDTAIVFDAAGAPPGLPRQLMHDGITVHFAQRHSDADEMIEELLEECAAPRNLLVVSSDHRVQRAARHFGASFVDSDEWYREVLAKIRQRQANAEEAPTKPNEDLTPEELNYWMRQFGDGAKQESAIDDPFPPGYGDDIQMDEE
jgi:predicted RNA-binding protein with PIN domain